MDTDLALVIGLIVGGLSIPAMLSSISDRRAPRASILTVLIAAGLLYFAFTNKPGGYAMEDIPDVFINVIARIIS